MFPSNESETIELYRLCNHQLNWQIAHLQTAFPDAIIENNQGHQLVAEFEYKARNFKQHKHDVNGCDLIICWHNDWPDAPLPVWALEDCLLDEAIIVRNTITFCHNQTFGMMSFLENRVRELVGEKEKWRVEAEIAERCRDYWKNQVNWKKEQVQENLNRSIFIALFMIPSIIVLLHTMSLS